MLHDRIVLLASIGGFLDFFKKVQPAFFLFKDGLKGVGFRGNRCDLSSLNMNFHVAASLLL